MIVLFKMVLILLTIVGLILKQVNIGNAMFIGTLAAFFLSNPTGLVWMTAVKGTVLNGATWVIVLAMFFVMCLEYQLRTSRILERFMDSLRILLKNERLLLFLMPAFLGFLPSLGGALFSAPLVENASKSYNLTAEDKTAINYWFRHVWEYTNPILPAVLLASIITAIPIGILISHQIWITVLALIVGWVVLLTGKKFRRSPQTLPEKTQKGAAAKTLHTYASIVLAVGPILANIVLVTVFHFNAALSMGIVILIMVSLLKYGPRDVGKMLKSSLNLKILWSVLSILFFQHMLLASNMIDDVVMLFKLSGLTIPIIAGLTSFTIGLLTGTSQGNVAIAFPIISALAPGDLNLVAIGFVTGMAGQMLSPTHLCFVITLEYFKAKFLKVLIPIAMMEIPLILAVYLVAAYC